MSIDVLVVLCGGAGERLWPASHPERPKPLIPFGGETLLAATVARFRPLGARVVLVCGAEHAAAMQAEAPDAALFVEPARRGTGPAVVDGARWARAQVGPDAVVLVTPADHAVAAPERLLDAVRAGAPHARRGDLVTFGIVPEGPEPGYGYVEIGEPLGADAHRIARFTEKPDADKAARLIAEGALWNSGMFLFSVAGLDAQLARSAPDLAAGQARGSFDVLVAERTDRGVVVPVDCGWSDVGTWAAVARQFPTGGAFVWAEDVEVRIDGVTGVGVAASPRGVRIFRL